MVTIISPFFYERLNTRSQCLLSKSVIIGVDGSKLLSQPFLVASVSTALEVPLSSLLFHRPQGLFVVATTISSLLYPRLDI